MDIRVKTTQATSQKSACLIVAIHEKRQLSPSAKALDSLCNKRISNLVKKGDFDGKLGHTWLLDNPDGIPAERIMLVGCGSKKKLNIKTYRKMHGHILNALKKTNIKDATLYTAELEIKDTSTADKIRHASEAILETSYSFDELKSSHKKTITLKNITFNIENKRDLPKAQQALKTATAIATGMDIARRLGNLPGNICTPNYLAKQATNQAKSCKKTKVTVLGEAEMKKLKMGSLLSVSKGSRQPPKLIVIEYKGGKAKDKPYVLVGKGVTFDTGGISLKPGAAMDEMKFDMCGAAGVIGTMAAVSKLQLGINVVAIVPSVENMPDGAASRPGDIVTSMSGQTIEILNTDAEGRLILCDALTYAEKFNPKTVIDTATLTGACVVALGSHCSAVLSNNDKLAQELLNAGSTSGDRTWQMPLWEDYQDQLKSNFADMANIGGREAGTITAACFLARFTKKYKWAHLDIAGVAWHSGARKGATGRPVPLLTQYLMNQT
ncbi:Cytosol aminopeptidase PepA [hydrothermal vent metagenome]|uniref:leucyl aminopeptidase n=1 Tax=hydrothermal vent metagenome TaxID=652676 RepID=A0A3B1ACY0_9ZZZZ